jgi:EmrB/QacA subfamily drug resistance transporter
MAVAIGERGGDMATHRAGGVGRCGWVLSISNFEMTFSKRHDHSLSHKHSHGPLTKAELRRIFYGLTLAMFLSALNQTIVATALPTIGREFGDLENLSWVIIAYLLSSTVVAPLYGKLSDIHGRRSMMLVAVGLFIAGSAASAVAGDMTTLIIARTLQGIGGGGIVPLTQTTIADMVSPRERGRYQAYIGSAWIAAGTLGPALGGVIAEHLHWSLIFWLNVPLGLLAALLTNRAMKRLPRQERAHQLDIIGAALLMAAATLILLALTWGGTRVPWISPTILVLVAFSFVLTLVFVWWLRRTEEPFLPLNVMRNPVMRAGTAATSCTLGAMIGLTVYMPLYFQAVHKLSVSEAGFALIPIVVMTSPGSMLSGRSMMYLRRYKWSSVIGASIAIASLSTLVLWPMMPFYGVLAALLLVGFGAGTVYPVATVAIQNAVPTRHLGTATGAMNFFRALASTLAVAIMGAILLGHLGATLQRGGTGIEVLTQAAGGDFNMAGVFRWVFAAADIFLALALAAVLLMEERPLRGPASGPMPAQAPAAPAE